MRKEHKEQLDDLNTALEGIKHAKDTLKDLRKMVKKLCKNETDQGICENHSEHSNGVNKESTFSEELRKSTDRIKKIIIKAKGA